MLNSVHSLTLLDKKTLRLSKNPIEMINRIDISYLLSVSPGIVFTSGRRWKETRRFTMQMMRDFGMGKMASEENIRHEAAKAIRAFAAHQGRPFDPMTTINMAVSNIICAMVFGKKYDYDDENFRTSLAALNTYVHEASKPMTFLLMTSLGKLLLGSHLATIQRNHDRLAKFVRDEIEQHKVTYDGKVHDYIDAYLAEMETTKDTDVFNGQCFSLLNSTDSSKRLYTHLDREYLHRNAFATLSFEKCLLLRSYDTSRTPLDQGQCPTHKSD